MFKKLASQLSWLALAGTAWLTLAPPAAAAGPFNFYAITPCRVLDTRLPNGPQGGPIITGNTTRTINVQSVCGVPLLAKAVVVNVTVVSPAGQGYLTLWPSDQAKPTVAAIVFNAGQLISNGLLVPLAAATPDLSIYAFATTHVVVDVTGYYGT